MNLSSRRRWHLLFGFSVVFAAAIACGSSDDKSGFGNGDTDGGTSSGTDGGGPTLGNGDGGTGFGGGSFNASTFALTPATSTLDVTMGVDAGAGGMVQFKATDNGAPLNGVLFDIADRGELGSVGPTSGLFTASGTLGGTVTVEATYMGATAKATIAIVMHSTQNGATDALTAPPMGGGTAVTAFGPGGYGGVGGDGSGGAVTATQQASLDAAGSGGDGGAGAGDGASWLYPYDNTLFPRGILAPLLQWSVGSSGDYQAVKVTLTEAGFQYTGYFAKPFLAKTFGDIPIPASVWTSIYSSYTSATAKEDLQVTVALLPKGTGAAFALPPRTWHIAGGSLRGKIYYQSYGTHLATSSLVDFNNNHFGGATLAISPGASAPDPTPAAGDDNPANTDNSCRVCHSVALSGSALITQEGNNKNTSAYYDLGKGTNTAVANIGSAYPGITPDGTMMLTDTVPSTGATNPATSSFYTVPGGLPVAIANTPANLNAIFPGFSADGTKLAYTDGTPGAGKGGALVVSPIDLVGKTFGTPKPMFTPAANMNAYWPSFMPASDGVVFEQELVYNGRDIGGTRPGCDTRSDPCLLTGTHGELWYVNLASGKSTRLDNANGNGFLPPHPSALAADVNLDAQFNYEPTVNPVVSGGYAWIVFTSRRLYGNVATINPFTSDPRYTDISANPTTKKLWVAAIDLSADGSADTSFPAFYLPGQELLAGNGRAFWVVEPCEADGSSCETGDQCCGGYCQPSGDGGALVCSDVKPTCAAEYDKCTTAADCCDTTLECIGGRCSVSAPR